MTASSERAESDLEDDAECFDVLIVGAGISGIGAAYRITERNPDTRYVVLERRERIGGTWDVFRYPGVRSDSSIFTLGLPYEPWTQPGSIAEGADIQQYLTDAAHKYGIDAHIRFGSYVRAANWDSDTDTWTVQVEQNGSAKSYRARFLFFGSGYYNYDQGYTPDFPGIENFGGTVVHPQHWPENLDYAGKRVVVIGSGATAITVVPALARTAAKVTMLQRSPTYIAASARIQPIAEFARKVLPRHKSHTSAKWFNILLEGYVWFVSRRLPGYMRNYFRRQAIKNLPPGYPVDVHFNPRYNPWDQRLCLDADSELFGAIKDGRVEVVTSPIEGFDTGGITVKSGQHIDADIVVTATGLQLQALGGVQISLDGTEIKPQDRFVYKAHLLEEVPNLAWCVGYTNASWTLRADMTAQQVAKLLSYMTSHGYTHAYPHRGSAPMPEKHAWDIQAGYVLRAPHALPKSGVKRPWNVRQNYFADAIDHHFDRIEESMIFGRAADRTAAATVSTEPAVI